MFVFERRKEYFFKKMVKLPGTEPSSFDFILKGNLKK